MNYFNLLSKHIIDHIFEYDNTYREIYSKCINQVNYKLLQKFRLLNKYKNGFSSISINY